MGDKTNNIKGEQGGVVLGDTTATYTATGPADYLLGFTVISDATVSALTMPDMADSDDLIGVTFVAGSFVPGLISAITVDSGLIMGLFHSAQA